MAAEDPANWKHPLTHLEITGWLQYKKHEADGDWHLRICDSQDLGTMDPKHCIVAEIIPELPAEVPDMGAHITVRGIARYDAENPGHHWWEVHPVEQLEILPD